ncbi:MAG: NAD(P)H-binding protein [Proteobacteria bacterium]|nr:NAD(P)H-binding protein [Pseudomonadota bacterium]
MKIAVFGATGMIGSRLVAEAARRGHHITAVSRSGKLPHGATAAIAMELNDTARVVALMDASDATVIAIPPDRQGGSHAPILKAHRDLIAARPKGRFLVVGGAGALEVDGIRLKDMPSFPVAYQAEASTFSTILDLYRASQGLNWTMLTPAPEIAPGARTGHYRVGTDSPAGDTISAEDFVVAIVDELEKPTHAGKRFTVAN